MRGAVYLSLTVGTLCRFLMSCSSLLRNCIIATKSDVVIRIAVLSKTFGSVGGRWRVVIVTDKVERGNKMIKDLIVVVVIIICILPVLHTCLKLLTGCIRALLPVGVLVWGPVCLFLIHLVAVGIKIAIHIPEYGSAEAAIKAIREIKE